MSADAAQHHSPEQIEAIYTRLAIVYDAWTWMLERKGLHAALDHADIRDGESILEVAVGSGQVFREVLRRNRNGRNVGVDLTDAMLRKTRRKALRTGVPFVLECADARRLPFGDASFDLVLNNNMLGLLPRSEVEPVLAEMKRVLRPGGRLVAVLMSRPRHRLPRWIYQLGVGRLGAWSDVDLGAFTRVFGRVEHAMVTQLGFPSEILCARRTAGQPATAATARPGSSSPA